MCDRVNGSYRQGRKEGRKVCANLTSKGLILVEAIALGDNPNILTLHTIGSAWV